MAATRFESQSKGWQGFTQRSIGSLRPLNYGVKLGRYKEDINSFAEDDECIYYSTVYGKDHKLKLVSNPGFGKFAKPHSKFKDEKLNKTMSTKVDKYDAEDEGTYELLSCTTEQPPVSHSPFHTALSTNRDRHTPVPMNMLRAMKNDLVSQQNTGRVMTFEPDSYRPYLSSEYVCNNNCVEKAKLTGHSGFVSQQSSHSLMKREDSEELLDYCTCMCFVKGAFYHFTKDNEDEGQIADEPCSCAGPLSQCLPRWCCLSAFSMLFPCLCCYPPLKGCKKLRNLVNESKTTATEKKTSK